MICRTWAFASVQARSVSSFRDPGRKGPYLGRVVDLSFGYAHESRHGEMWRSSLRLLAALGFRRTLGETSALYQSGHASQFRPKPKRKMSTMVKATPCCRLTKDSRRRQPDSAALIARLDRRHALHTSDVDEPLQESGGARGVNSRDCDAGDAFSARWTSEPTRPIQESDCQQSSTADEIVGHAAFGWQTHLRAIPVRQRGHVDVWAATKTPATRAFSARMDPVAEHRGRAA